MWARLSAVALCDWVWSGGLLFGQVMSVFASVQASRWQ